MFFHINRNVSYFQKRKDENIEPARRIDAASDLSNTLKILEEIKARNAAVEKPPKEQPKNFMAHLK